MNMDMDSFLVEYSEITCLVLGVVRVPVPLKGAPVFRGSHTAIQTL